MKGKIIKGIGGFYYVHVPGEGVFECRARGIFRKEKRKPLVGDDVEISVTDDKDREGSVDRLLPRKNELIRPAAANVDQALVVFAAASPKPNLNLLDRFLIYMQQQSIPVIICFNKADLVEEAALREYLDTYRGYDTPVLGISVAEKTGLDRLWDYLRGKTTIVAGPSGVGKSSLTNYLQPDASMEIGEVSRKIDRGRHTTRHTELIWIGDDTYFLDTPGFSSLYVKDITPQQLGSYYPEFAEFEPECRFNGCLHMSEPDCGVKSALARGEISASRYENYQQILEELKDQKSYR